MNSASSSHLDCSSCRTAQRVAIGVVLSGVIVAVSVLTGCGGGMKNQIAEAINAKLNKEKVCYSLQEKKVPIWPLRVQRPGGFGGVHPLDPILVAMQAAGYVKVTEEQQAESGPWPVDVIMPTEQAKKWWDVQDGFCVGTKAVAQIQQWKEISNGIDTTVPVNFTWHLVNVPSWAKRPEFKDIPGMSTPVQQRAAMVKTDKGWKVVF